MSRAESKERTRRALLDSAREVFAEKGFHAATVEEIAARAGFTRGAFYANFADKTDAFWSLVEDQETASFAQLAGDVAQAAEGEALPLVERWFVAILAHPSLDRAFAEVQSQVHDEASRARLAALQASHHRAVADVVRQQAEAHGFSVTVPLDELAAAMLGLGHGLLMLKRVNPDLVPESLFADAMAWLFTGAAGGPEGPAAAGVSGD